MMTLENYLNDGACVQARCVLAYIQSRGVELKNKTYQDVNIGRWCNCREQGYVISLTNINREQLNIVWFEHRNTDSICIIRWEQSTFNLPNIDTIPEQEYRDKWDTDFSFGYGEYSECSDKIIELLENHWNKCLENV